MGNITVSRRALKDQTSTYLFNMALLKKLQKQGCTHSKPFCGEQYKGKSMQSVALCPTHLHSSRRNLLEQRWARTRTGTTLLSQEPHSSSAAKSAAGTTIKRTGLHTVWGWIATMKQGLYSPHSLFPSGFTEISVKGDGAEGRGKGAFGAVLLTTTNFGSNGKSSRGTLLPLQNTVQMAHKVCLKRILTPYHCSQGIFGVW